MFEKITQTKELSPMLMRVMQICIDQAKQLDGWVPLKSIYIKAISRLESHGTYATVCGGGHCKKENLQEACEQAGVKVDDVKKLLIFREGDVQAFPTYRIDMDLVQNAVNLTIQYDVPRENFIFACVEFGLFNLESHLVLCRALQEKNPFDFVQLMMKNPVRQVFEFNHQFVDAWQRSGGDFSDAANFWRTGLSERKPHDYGALAKQRYHELRLQGHYDA